MFFRMVPDSENWHLHIKFYFQDMDVRRVLTAPSRMQSVVEQGANLGFINFR